MTDENDNEDKPENGENGGDAEVVLEGQEEAVNSGGRAPSRAKSRGSISDQRKV